MKAIALSVSARKRKDQRALHLDAVKKIKYSTIQERIIRETPSK